jgi:hypothetical protein
MPLQYGEVCNRHQSILVLTGTLVDIS